MANYHFIRTTNKKEVLVLDTDNMQFRKLKVEQVQSVNDIDNFNTKLLQYKYDNISVPNSSGTIVLYDKNNEYYGVITTSNSGKPSLHIVSKDKINEYESKHKVCNTALFRIKEIPEDTNMENYARAYIKYIRYFKSDAPQKEESIEETTNNTVEESVSNIEKETTEKISEKTTGDIELLKQRLQEAICKTENLSAYSANEVIVSVKDIFTFKKPITKPKNKQIIFPHYTYELILKSVGTGDVISVPKSYFETLSVFRIRLLEKSSHDLGYAAIEKIKFNKNLEEFLIAIAEFERNSDMVRLYICNEYGTEEISDNDIGYYTVNYTSMRKQIKMVFREEDE